LPKKPSIRLKAPKPYASYAPASGARYSADSDGFFDVAPEHVPAVAKQGCQRLD